MGKSISFSLLSPPLGPTGASRPSSPLLSSGRGPACPASPLAFGQAAQQDRPSCFPLAAALLAPSSPSLAQPATRPNSRLRSPAVRMCARTAQLPSLRPAYAARDAELHGPVPSPMGPARQPEKKGKDGDAASPSARRLPSVVLFAWYPASPSPPASSVSQPDDAARTPRPTARPRMPLRARRLEPRLALRTRRDTTGLAPHRALTAPASRPHHTVTCSSSRTFPSRAPTPYHGWTPRVRLPHPDDRSRP